MTEPGKETENRPQAGMPSNKRNTRIIALATLLLVVAAIALVYKHTHPRYSTAYSAVMYNSSSTYKLPGNHTNPPSGLSFLQPKDFVVYGKPTNTDATFVQYSPGDKKYVISQITATSQAREGDKAASDYLKKVNDAFNKKGSDEYKAEKLNILYYLQNSLSGYDLDLSDPVALKTANINKNAWVFNYAAKAKIESNGYKAGDKVHEGKLVLAIGEKSYYFFKLQSIESNWQAYGIWDQIIDSLKIDQ
jgi:hypothetical protein